MTETEWLRTFPVHGLWRLWEDWSPRKRRLYCCACCRRVWSTWSDARGRRAVEVAEAFADGLVTPECLAEAYRRAEVTVHEYLSQGGPELGSEAGFAPVGMWYSRYGTTKGFAEVAAPDMTRPFDSSYGIANTAVAAGAKWEEECAAICSLARCIFGSPFRPVPVLDREWLTSTVTALSKGMYESRDFGAMPILADALQDAGCDSDDILSHCRRPGPHARGCWVVDLILGKA